MGVHAVRGTRACRVLPVRLMWKYEAVRDERVRFVVWFPFNKRAEYLAKLHAARSRSGRVKYYGRGLRLRRG